MKLSFNNMLYSLSYALDCVEQELLGVATNHGKRVAYLCIAMGKQLDLGDIQLMDLAACAILHDNALTEYIQSEYLKGNDVIKEKGKLSNGVHCSLGERNVEHLTLCKEAKNAVLYHHENANGSGTFHKTAAETPIFAQMIHIADQVDAHWDLGEMDKEKYKGVLSYVREGENTLFSEQCVELFCNAIKFDKIEDLKAEGINESLKAVIKYTEREYSQRELIDFAEMFANIIDYKSQFTCHHSRGVAEKAAQMAEYYGYDSLNKTKMFVAGALHDIGKLAVVNEILEKPDKLTLDEFRQIQEHAIQTYYMLYQIKGFEDITSWASLHHEKLNGKGYPFGKTAEELGFNERIMACLDVYQALTEKRPYKDGLSHEQSVAILREMVEDGSLDGSIANDIDKIFGSESICAV